MPETQKRYVLNTNSKKIHDTLNADGRCKLSSMKPECKTTFDTLEEALAWPNSEHPLARKCRFCIGD